MFIIRHKFSGLVSVSGPAQIHLQQFGEHENRYMVSSSKTDHDEGQCLETAQTRQK